jgi:hypothetical protein
MGNLMKKLLDKLFGLDKIREKKQEADQLKQEALEISLEAKKIAEDAKLTPKQRATERKEPWVAVLETHVNKENLRNGFFELDWNEYFVLQLKQEGYGSEGDPDEEVVDRWFRTLCKDVANEEGVDMSERGAGYINVKKIAEGKSEVS